MKRMYFVLTLLLLATSNAFATGCGSGSDQFAVDSWCIDDEGTLTPQSTAGQRIVVESYTTANTNNTLTTQETGVHIVDLGGSAAGGTITCSGGSKHILPRAAAGMEFTLTAGNKCSVTLDTVDTSDTIVYSISGTGLDAGDSIKSTQQAGDSVTLFSPAANVWHIKQMKAVWTDNGTN